MLLYAILAALSLVGPLAIFIMLDRDVVIERVKANVAMISLLGNTRASNEYDIVNAFLPGDRTMMLEVPLARMSQFRSSPIVDVYVTLSKATFGGTYISAVEWPGESKAARGAPKNGGLFLSVIYLILGICATGFAVQPEVYAELGRLGTTFAGLLVAMSGLTMATLHMKPLPLDARASMLWGMIKLGGGRSSLILATLIACSLTAACYWYGGAGLFLGINFGCAAGMLLGMLMKQTVKPGTNPVPNLV